MIILRIDGFLCKLNENKWKCADSTLEDLLNSIPIPPGPVYVPDPEKRIADFIMDKFGGELVSQTGVKGKEDAIY